MLIPIVKPAEETIYAECQHLKDLYKNGAVVGVYAESFIDDKWECCLSKTVLKDNCIETLDRCIIRGENDEYKEFSEFLKDVSYVIYYRENSFFDAPKYNVERIDLEVMAMHCQYYFRYRGLNTFDIEGARCTFEYGYGIEGIDMQGELTDLIGNILKKYEDILKQDEEKNKSE